MTTNNTQPNNSAIALYEHDLAISTRFLNEMEQDPNHPIHNSQHPDHKCFVSAYIGISEYQQRLRAKIEQKKDDTPKPVHRFIHL